MIPWAVPHFGNCSNIFFKPYSHGRMDRIHRLVSARYSRKLPVPGSHAMKYPETRNPEAACFLLPAVPGLMVARSSSDLVDLDIPNPTCGASIVFGQELLRELFHSQLKKFSFGFWTLGDSCSDSRRGQMLASYSSQMVLMRNTRTIRWLSLRFFVLSFA